MDVCSDLNIQAFRQHTTMCIKINSFIISRLFTEMKTQAKKEQFIDLIIKLRFRNSVKDMQTQPGADMDSDLNLQVAEICTRLKRIIKCQKRKPVSNLEKL
jgi:hypothetical protein